MASTLHSNLTFLSSHHSSPKPQPIATVNLKPTHYVPVRCGPRDNRGPLVKGRILSTEAIQAVQSLKRAHKANPTSPNYPSLSRLIKNDLLASLRELLRQNECAVALHVFSALISEYPNQDLALLADLVAALARNRMTEEIDSLIGELEEIDGSDERNLVRVIKGVVGAGLKESTVRIFWVMKRNGVGCDWKVDEYVAKVLSKGLRCFGEVGLADEVPQRLYSLDELKLNGIDTSSLLSPVDGTLGSIERNPQLAAVSGGVAAWNVFDFNPQQIFYLSLALLFLWTLDSVSFNGGIGSLVIDTIGHTFSQKYHNRVIQHEAGHFLIAYLVGILPKAYTLSSLEALKKEGSLNLQAGTAFVGFEFLEEVNTGKVSATTLNRFSCIALAGVATEYLLYGYAEGGLDDINKLDVILRGLGFTQKKADSQVRWSVLNTVLLLRRHKGARAKLAEAMSMGKSVGSCIEIIEDTIDEADI
ncbi:hypothetical protein Q3G72_026826 [Acer saccharum]|nr:hypothetical protein Q3G72_026826 [Acer saccharum]